MTAKEWQRCGEGFQLKDEGPDNRKHASKVTKAASYQKSFGQKWIESEESFQLSRCFHQKSKGSTSDSQSSFETAKICPTAKDNVSICWNDSDSDTEDRSKKQNIPPPAKRLRTKQPTKDVKQKRKSTKNNSKLNHGHGRLARSVDSDSEEEAISASDSEEEKDACAESGGLSQLSTSGSPVLQIECVGSPEHSPSQTTDDEEWKGDGQNNTALQKYHHTSASPNKNSCSGQGTPSISSCTSSQTAADSDVSPAQSGLRVSEWARQMKLQTTPTKDKASPPAQQGDSAKKKKKFTKGGLAEQMARILLRDKSARRMWQHQQTSEDSQGSKSMKVEVKGVRTAYCLQIADCSVVLDSATRHPSANSQCSVFFSPVSTQHTAALQPGTTVQIFAPWQQLQISDGRQVLLCTRYCVTSTPSPTTALQLTEVAATSSSAGTSGSPPPATGHGRWLCPCSSEARMMAAKCPASLFPFLPSSIIQNIAANQHSASDRPERMLYTVKCSEAVSKKTLIFDTLLEAIEKAQSRDKLLGRFQATVLRVFCEQQEADSDRYSALVEDMQGTVALVTAPNPFGNIEGCLCCFSCLRVHSRTNADRDPALFSTITGAWSDRERKETASQQSSRETHSADSCRTSQRVVQPPGFCYMLEVDSCALSSVTGENWLTVVTAQSTDHAPSIVLSTLAQLLQVSSCKEPYLVAFVVMCVERTRFLHLDTMHSQEQNSRVSVMGQLVYHGVNQSTQGSPQDGAGDPDGDTNTKLLYITDHTLQADPSPTPQDPGDKDSSALQKHTTQDSHYLPAYVTVEVQHECSTDHLRHEAGRSQDTVPQVILLRDIWNVHGTWIADRYSRLLTCQGESQEVTAWRQRLDPEVLNRVTQHCPQFPAVSALSQTNSLMRLSGVIQSVDEKTAMSWEECDGCGSEQLVTRTVTGSLECLSCRKTVSCPVQRMKMEVVVQSDCCPVTVSVSLQQSTIEELLPDEEDEEGYDVDCVLDRHVGPVNCVITSAATTATGIHMKAVQLPR